MMGMLLRLAFLLKSVWAQITHPVQLGVRMVLIQDGEALLVRHTYMRGWHFPGGSMNRWETPLEAAAREAREEAGVELLEMPTLVGVFTSYGGGKSDHVMVYQCRNFRVGQATDQWEIAERKFFPLGALPPELGQGWHRIVRNLLAEQSATATDKQADAQE
jgi:ADP-ribose pyrophosphatase YjhB (NUDIX family)